MKPLDTSDEAWRLLIQIWREMPGAEKVAQAWEHSRAMMDLFKGGIRSRHPAYSEEEVRLAAARRTLGDDLFRQAYPGKPLLRL